MDTKDVKAFRLFVERIKGAEKCLELFGFIRKETDPEVIFIKLYNPPNPNAYHSLRKSLTRLLEEFFAHRAIMTDESHPLRELSMGMFLLNHHDYRSAARFFERTAMLATKRRDYKTLDQLYSLMIDHAVALEIPIVETIEKWKMNSEKLRFEQELLSALAMIRSRLQEARIRGSSLDPDVITREVFGTIRLGEESFAIPDFMLRVVEMVRSAVISSKEYSRFELFLIRVYQRLVKAGAFGKNDKAKARFYYLLAHTAYRNRHFSVSEQHLHLLEEEFGLNTRAIQLKAANKTYLGKNGESIELLHTLLSRYEKKLSSEDLWNVRLNLAVYHFQSMQYRKALNEFLKIPQEDRAIEKKLGKEWRLKKNMIELIIHYELGNTDLALSRIQSVEKYFSAFFEHPMYRRAGTFLKFIRFVIEYPEKVTTSEFEQMVADAKLGLPEDREDTQAITFFCWLKSKMKRKPYYEVLIETMNENS